MLPLHTFFLLIIMVGSLCALLWGNAPGDSLRESQAERVHRVATVSFY